MVELMMGMAQLYVFVKYEMIDVVLIPMNELTVFVELACKLKLYDTTAPLFQFAGLFGIELVSGMMREVAELLLKD